MVGTTASQVLSHFDGPIVVSRSLSPEVASAFELDNRTGVERRPTVRGATVWGDVDRAAVIVEQPNGFGRPEFIPAGRLVIVVLESGAPPPQVEHDHMLAVESVVARHGPSMTTEGYAAATTQARRLALLLGQVPRFRLPHGTPRSPRFVAMFGVDPDRVTSAFATSRALAAVGVAERFPDLPGGVLIRVEAAASEETLRAQVAVVDAMIRQGE